MSKLKTLMTLIIDDRFPLLLPYKDHTLQGNYKGYRGAHIEPNWLLIDKLIRFERTSTPADLFR